MSKARKIKYEKILLSIALHLTGIKVADLTGTEKTIGAMLRRAGFLKINAASEYVIHQDSD